MGDEPEDIRTLKEKALFYTTAFFVLLGTFSLFAFLFLVPFVIDPAFTTIFMQFDENPALCVTVQTEHFKGASNCSWTSCREGCTKEVYECTQITVNYKVTKNDLNETIMATDMANRDNNLNNIKLDVKGASGSVSDISGSSSSSSSSSSSGFSSSSGGNSKSKSGRSKRDSKNSNNENINSINSDKNTDYIVPNKYSKRNNKFLNNDNELQRFERAIREYDDYGDDLTLLQSNNIIDKHVQSGALEFMEYGDLPEMTGLMGNDSEWYFTGAKLFPNVKGCGYPPMLNCTIWAKLYKEIGSNFSCYYSKIDPGLVISDLDMWQNTLNLIYAMAIPIPSFIISVIYLTFAYFKIYNEDEESVPLDKNAEDIAAGDEPPENCVDIIVSNGGTAPPAGTLTPNSDLASFGHQLKVKMADEMSRESLDAGFLSNSVSLQGNLSKTMTTSISTQPGPIASV